MNLRVEAGSGVASPAVLRSQPSAWRRVVDFVTLTKPRVVLMVLVTTAVGYRLGSVGTADWVRLLQTLAGTALAAAGTLALNQYLERESDGLMRRTQRRALPSGRLTASEALAFGILATLIGLGYLAAQGQSLFDVNQVYAALFVVTAVAVVVDFGLVLIERRATRWMPRPTGTA